LTLVEHRRDSAIGNPINSESFSLFKSDYGSLKSLNCLEAKDLLKVCFVPVRKIVVVDREVWFHILQFKLCDSIVGVEEILKSAIVIIHICDLLIELS